MSEAQFEPTYASEYKGENCYFQIQIGDNEPETVTFKLYDNVVPKTCKNFRLLCVGKNAAGNDTPDAGYTGTKFHRVISQFMCQGGDFTKNNGTGGHSIWGEDKFNDENFQMKHTKPGLLSMANAGPNTNGSQFFITIVATSWLDGKHVVFGEVVEGMDVIKKMDGLGSSSGKPQVTITIVKSGLVKDLRKAEAEPVLT